ncbi:MAG: cytochrome c [Methylococcales bacterium]|nr:cytochrome c [Methylococcales bacterium]
MRTLHLLLLVFTTAAAAGESRIVLKDGQGKDSVMSQCAICHSLDYIVVNDRILNRAGWEKTVDKMINLMGAPINNADRQIIVDYLALRYGK